VDYAFDARAHPTHAGDVAHSMYAKELSRKKGAPNRLNASTAATFYDIGERLYSDWSRYWDDLKQPHLIEKSPPNIIKTLFLARAFHPAPTSFVMMMRHPFGAGAHFILNKGSYDHAPDVLHDLDCGERFLRHWLVEMKLFRSDLMLIPRSVNVTVVMFENFTRSHVKEHYDQLLTSVGLSLSGAVLRVF
jgi:hypothetical protein